MLRAIAGVTVVLFASLASAQHEVTFKVTGEDGELMPCRIHVSDEDGKPVLAKDLPAWRDHFVCEGKATLSVSNGKYEYVVERGKEFTPQNGSFKIENTDAKITVTLSRAIDMAARGWYSGELHVHRAVEELPLHMQAEDLHVAPVITWWNGRDLWKSRPLPETTRYTVNGNRFYDVMSGEDEREGGALMYYGLKKPLPLPGGKGQFPEYPSPMKFVELARKHDNVWIDLEKPFWWDTPVWLASGQINSGGLANNHMCRSQMYETEAWGRPRDAKRLPPPRGNGMWTQEIYYHILNSGLRIPPSAGSASGVLPNPVGYNRVYVHTAEKFSWDAWWRGLRRGRSFVTNGPLLICTVNGKVPGDVFRQVGGRIALKLKIEMQSHDNVPAIEVVWNGKVVKSLTTEGRESAQLEAKLEFNGPGWLLVRAIADRKETFRFASTAPWYVELANPDIADAPGWTYSSRKSAQFFADWVDERIERVAQKLKDPAKLRAVLEHHEKARVFWQKRVAASTAP